MMMMMSFNLNHVMSLIRRKTEGKRKEKGKWERKAKKERDTRQVKRERDR